VICGSAVHQRHSSRMVVFGFFDMPLIAAEVSRFYPNM
jgi:hypothetical protein